MEQRDLWLERGKAFFIQLFDSFSAPPVAVQPSVWYSGLGIEPVEFSEQLVRLQTSLNYAGAVAPGNVAQARPFAMKDQTAPAAH
jgi:hypothetical protein